MTTARVKEMRERTVLELIDEIDRLEQRLAIVEQERDAHFTRYDIAAAERDQAEELLEHAEDKLAELEALLQDQARAWQLIETSPKDGRWMLLVERVPPTDSDRHRNPNAKEAVRVTIGRQFMVTNELIGWERYGVGLINQDLLTHWMPLPDPPVVGDAS